MLINFKFHRIFTLSTLEDATEVPSQQKPDLTRAASTNTAEPTKTVVPARALSVLMRSTA